jgi:hypothetical protein
MVMWLSGALEVDKIINGSREGTNYSVKSRWVRDAGRFNIKSATFYRK